MVLSARDVAVLDANAEALGVPVETLMENAGRAVADRVQASTAPGDVTLLVGPGNNGGDGLVAARLLADRGFRVRVVTPVTSWRAPLVAGQASQLPASVEVVRVRDEASVRGALTTRGPVVDALFGVGFHGPMRPPYDAIVAQVNASRARVVSVDVPSGLGTPQAINAAETVTFHDVKEGMTPENSGRITVADIGIPARAATHTGPGEALLYPATPSSQHKGQGGVVLVLGGGPYTGAPAVAGLAALRAGADLAILLVPRRAWPVVASYSPNLVVRPLQGDDLDFDDPSNRVALNLWLKKADALLVGPGAGLQDVAKRAMVNAVGLATEERVPVVADADAITTLAETPKVLSQNVLLTPHSREFLTLTGARLPDDETARAETARLAAARLGTNLLVKGPVDVITDGARVRRNATGHPAMTVGGTGDVLSGVCAALVAKGLGPFDAARLGAWLVGKAGEVAAARNGPGLLATDVVDALPGVLVAHGCGRVADARDGTQADAARARARMFK